MGSARMNYRVLMGTAALAIIAFVAVNFWDRWQARREAEQAAGIAYCEEARLMAKQMAEGTPTAYRRSLEAVTATVAQCAREGR